MTLRLNNDNGNSASIDYVDGVSTNSTITIPEADGTVALVGAAGGLAGNISAATIFRLNDDFSTNNATITGWEAPDQAGESAGVGGAVTEASGIFTFPETGIWLVVFNSRLILAAGNTGFNVFTDLSTNSGTNFSSRALCSGGNASASDTNQNAASFAIFDVATAGNTTQVRFTINSVANGSGLRGESNSNLTTALFLRLGDT